MAVAQALGMLAIVSSVVHAERLSQAWRLGLQGGKDAHAESLVEEGYAAVDGAGVEKVKWPRTWAGRLSEDATRAGGGRFGTVYVTTVICDASRVAIKKVNVTDSPRKAEGSIKNEVGMLQVFGAYPSFIAYFSDFGPVSEGDSTLSHYIMMEWAKGGDLSDVVAGRNKATLAQKYELFYGALRGVELLHGRNIVHRDLKPKNILVSVPCGFGIPCVAKVGDFGYACQLRGLPMFDGVRACKGKRGTPAYIAPETYTYGIIDPTNDVWALGLTLFELTFNTLPKKFSRTTTLLALKSNVALFDIRSDSLFRSLDDGYIVKSLLEGMLANEFRERLSLKEVMGMALPLAGPSSYSRIAASLPDCFFYSGGAAPALPARPEDSGEVKYFYLDNPPANVIFIVTSYLFHDRMFDPATGVVLDPKRKLQSLRSRNYFPESLGPGDRILEINGRPYTSISPEVKENLKQGLYGNNLSIKYESRSPVPPSTEGTPARAGEQRAREPWWNLLQWLHPNGS